MQKINRGCILDRENIYIYIIEENDPYTTCLEASIW